MRTRGVVGALLSCLWAGLAVAQAPVTQDQPGLKWTDEQIKNTAHHVRAGRRLTPKSWPNGARVAVCMSVDPDNFSIALNAGNTNPVTISAGEYGALEGLPRMLRLFDKHNIPASFYIPAVAAMMHPEMIQEIRKRPRHEVGIHGWIHENPMDLDDPVEEWRLISQSLALLEKQWGRRPVGNRNPSWTMSTHTVGLLIKAGLLYDSSLQAMDEPHEVLLDGGVRDVSRRVRRGVRGRHDGGLHAPPARGRHAVAHHLPGRAHSLHEEQAGRLVRNGRADRALR